MEISQRELTLQKIIKNQEARIQELERLISAPPTSQPDRFMHREKEKELEEVILDLRERLREKEKENSQIKEELMHMRGEIRDEKEDKRNLEVMSKERDSFFKASAELEMKVKELESALRNASVANEKNVEKLQKANTSLTKQNNTYK